MGKFALWLTNELKLNVTGMHCNNCAISVHRLLEKRGLQNILVDFAGEEVKFSTTDQAPVPGIIKDIEGLGFRVVDDINLHTPRSFTKKLRTNLSSAPCSPPRCCCIWCCPGIFPSPIYTISIVPAGIYCWLPALWQKRV
jgi:copper chaperone CopZ